MKHRGKDVWRVEKAISMPFDDPSLKIANVPDYNFGYSTVVLHKKAKCPIDEPEHILPMITRKK